MIKINFHTDKARSNTTSFSVYHQSTKEIEGQDLLNFGYSKDHRPDLVQYRQMLATLSLFCHSRRFLRKHAISAHEQIEALTKSKQAPKGLSPESHSGGAVLGGLLRGLYAPCVHTPRPSHGGVPSTQFDRKGSSSHSLC
jgi:hypothetical protein